MNHLICSIKILILLFNESSTKILIRSIYSIKNLICSIRLDMFDKTFDMFNKTFDMFDKTFDMFDKTFI